VQFAHTVGYQGHAKDIQLPQSFLLKTFGLLRTDCQIRATHVGFSQDADTANKLCIKAGKMTLT